jgi:hypothetical protein
VALIAAVQRLRVAMGTRPTEGVRDWARCADCGFYACSCPDVEPEV